MEGLEGLFLTVELLHSGIVRKDADNSNNAASAFLTLAGALALLAPQSLPQHSP